MTERPLHPVTTKVALYSDDGHKVLIVEYREQGKLFGYGLPGGHLEHDEDPEQALRRELMEEFNLTTSDKLRRKDFFIHENGKVVLAFVGVISDDTVIMPSDPEYEVAKWVTKKEVSSLGGIDKEYKAFILENWKN